jgi:type II secretory pathway pseudopilin PulG
MVLMSTSTSRRLVAGFTLLELLVGLTLTMVLAAAIAPMWLGWQRAFAQSADRTVGGLQGRVVAERLERDLRLASTVGCGDLGCTSVLFADAHQVVFLSRTDPVPGPPDIVEWDIVGARLMRRTRVWPGSLPSSFPHQSFTDNKTMIERVSDDAAFSFYSGGAELVTPSVDLAGIDEVRLTAAVAGQSEPVGPGRGAPLLAVARVGR